MGDFSLSSSFLELDLRQVCEQECLLTKVRNFFIVEEKEGVMRKKRVTWEKKKKRLRTTREGERSVALLCLILCAVWVGFSQFIYLAESDSITKYLTGTADNSKDGLFVGALGGVPLFLLAVFFGARGLFVSIKQRLIVRFGQETKCTIIKPGNRMKRYFFGYKEKQYYFEVSYQGKNEPAKWRSPYYTENPMEYVEQGRTYPFYVWGKQCCMGPLEKEEIECERMPAIKGEKAEILYPIEGFNELSEEEKKAAYEEWMAWFDVATDCFVRLQPGILHYREYDGFALVYVEIRYRSQRVLGSEMGHRLAGELWDCMESMKETYRKSEHDAAAADIARKMKEAAQNRLGRIPVTEVLVYLD